MVKHILFSAALVVGFSVANAQTGKKVNFVKSQTPGKVKFQDDVKKHAQVKHICGTDEAMMDAYNHDPDVKARMDAMTAISEQKKLNKGKQTNSTQTVVPFAKDTIAIVFHILHENGSENISNQVVLDAVAQMNLDYQMQDPDTASIETYFKPRAAGANLVFVLATKDPLGNCTNGIIRHNTPLTVWDRTATTNYGSNNFIYTGTTSGKWDPKKYLNIYVVKDIYTGSTGGGTVVGYTMLPGTVSAGNKQDAIVYNYAFLGAANKDVRSLEHEIGHWLGLPHTFHDPLNPNSAGTTCGDDDLQTLAYQINAVDDTPGTKGAYSTCPAFGATNTCDAEPSNVQNIMDYSSCPNMFTVGQSTIMREVLQQTFSARSTLVTSATKIATGTRYQQVCMPVADFGADKKFACTGANVTYADSTLNAVTTSWSWSFPGGTPSTSTVASPVVTYASPGVYAASYTATNSAGSNSISKSNYITISNSTATNQTSLVEGFESITVPNTDWTIDNSNGGQGWAQTSSAAFTGTQSMMINNFTNPAGSVETFYTPSYNIAAINAASPGTTFTFKLSHKRKTTSGNDKLQVFSSINCGQTWTQRYSKSGSALANAGVLATAFTPASTADWRTETVSVAAVLAQTNVMYKFVFTSDAAGVSNNIFIDDINISNNGVGWFENLESQLNYIVFPNPNNGNMHVSFDLEGKHNVKLELVDLLGKTLETSVNSNLNAGSYDYAFGANQKLASGIYFSKLSIDGKSIIRKIIVE